ncbi:MAG: NmrA family NAD(P)-binding protein [Nitrospirota bacterium]
MLAITGATGKTGSKLTELLMAKGQAVRVIGRDAGTLKAFTAKGAEAAVGDMADRLFLTKAFTGAEAVFALIPPNFVVADFRAYQQRIGESIVAAIQGSGVKYVVDLSSQGAHLPDRTGPIKGLHDQEERLNKLEGVNALHLRPTYFMENLLMNISMIRKMNIMGSAVRGDVKFAMIATKDIAAYAAERLVRRDFTGKSVADLLGERDLSLDEAAGIIGKKLQKPDLTYVAFPYEDAEKGMVAMGLTPDLSRLYIEMSKALNDGLFAVNIPRTKENTTPTTFEIFADLFATAYHASDPGSSKVA